MRTLILGSLTALCLALPVAAQAQSVPSYATPQYSADQTIAGRIVSFDREYELRVRDDRGYIDNVRLRPGTIINPRGLTLAPGMVVSVLGYNAGSYFSATEIDTPYQFYRGFPYYAGHPWYYYGPSVSLGFFFGDAGWWHGGDRDEFRYRGRDRGDEFRDRDAGGRERYHDGHADEHPR